MRRSKGKVLVAMSGGVDSSVAAALLKEDGYEPIGCFMRLGGPGESLEEGPVEPDACGPEAHPGGARPPIGVEGRPLRIGHQGCCSINDAADARRVAAEIGIPFYVLNFRRDFGRIIDYFVAEYNAGRTPNPCVRCNDWLKFGKLAAYARSLDAGYIATGHYARTGTIGGRPALLRGADRRKDQSYVLFGSTPAQLRRMLLPVGRYVKSEVRRIAAELGLPVSAKPDSQEICFVPDGDYTAVVERRTPGGFRTGEVRDTAGRVVGRHGGHQRFTIGQRRGLRLALGRPAYVVDKDQAANTLTVGCREDLASGGCTADGTNWLIDPPADAPIPCTVKIRYNAAPVPATVQARGPDELAVRFDEPQHAIAPGQAVVCYAGDRVLGGGWIRSAEP